MISHWNLIHRLHDESGEYKKDLQTAYVRGIRYGLNRAVALVKEMHEEFLAMDKASLKRGKQHRMKSGITKRDYQALKASKVDASLDAMFPNGGNRPNGGDL